MSTPTLLSSDTLHRLMRIFMEYKTDILPVVERGRIIGQLDRLSIYESLSEIRPEGYALSVKPPADTNELLRRMDASGAEGLPTVNGSYEFNALWGRAEILQAQGKIPQVKIWQPETPASGAVRIPEPAGEQPLRKVPAEQETTFDTVAEIPKLRSREQGATLPVEPEPVPATITIVREAPAAAPRDRMVLPEGEKEAPRETRPLAEKLHRDMERGRLAINTLAALDLPLLACDGSGSEIFHNKSFGDLKLRFAATLVSHELVRKAKDAIAESALKGDLDIDRPVRLRSQVRGYTIYCKAIRDFENPTARAQGYIFWLESTGVTEASTPLYAEPGGTERTEFAGKTLPEILAAEETRAMAWAMREANGNQSDAALLLGIPRQTFNYRYRKLARQQAHKNRGREGEAGKPA